jgi:hypothetical protein
LSVLRLFVFTLIASLLSPHFYHLTLITPLLSPYPE